MTAIVTVKAAAHATQVRTYPCVNGDPVEGKEWSDPVVVAPGGERTFYVTRELGISIFELPEF